MNVVVLVVIEGRGQQVVEDGGCGENKNRIGVQVCKIYSAEVATFFTARVKFVLTRASDYFTLGTMTTTWTN